MPVNEAILTEFIVFFVVFLPLSIPLCAFSALYFAVWYKVPETSVAQWVGSMAQPLRFSLNYLVVGTLKDIAPSILSLIQFSLGRLLFAVPLLTGCVLAVLRTAGGTFERLELLYIRVIFICLYILTFIWAWRFGHQLKSIPAKLKSENPELVGE